MIIKFRTKYFENKNIIGLLLQPLKEEVWQKEDDKNGD